MKQNNVAQRKALRAFFQPFQQFIHLSVHPFTNTPSFSLLKYITLDTEQGYELLSVHPSC